jgi:hypothetical protein
MQAELLPQPSLAEGCCGFGAQAAGECRFAAFPGRGNELASAFTGRPNVAGQVDLRDAPGNFQYLPEFNFIRAESDGEREI